MAHLQITKKPFDDAWAEIELDFEFQYEGIVVYDVEDFGEFDENDRN